MSTRRDRTWALVNRRVLVLSGIGACMVWAAFRAFSAHFESVRRLHEDYVRERRSVVEFTGEDWEPVGMPFCWFRVDLRGNDTVAAIEGLEDVRKSDVDWDSAAVSADGTKAAFAAEGKRLLLQRLRPEPVVLHTYAGAKWRWVKLAAWSPDATKLACYRCADYYEPWVFTVLDCSGHESFTQDLGRDECEFWRESPPSWAPDSQRVCFSSLDGELRVLDLNSGLTVRRFPGATPCWLPNGDIRHLRDGRWHMAHDDLTVSAGAQFDSRSIVGGLVWSPDGRYAAFTRWDMWRAIAEIEQFRFRWRVKPISHGTMVLDCHTQTETCVDVRVGTNGVVNYAWLPRKRAAVSDR